MENYSIYRKLKSDLQKRKIKLSDLKVKLTKIKVEVATLEGEIENNINGLNLVFDNIILSKR